MEIHTASPGDALVAFKLDGLPDTEGKTVKLALKWKSFSGDKSAEFDYCTRKSLTSELSNYICKKQLQTQVTPL